MRLAGWRRPAHKHSAETEPADGQMPKSGALHEGALANVYDGAASRKKMVLRADYGTAYFPVCSTARKRALPLIMRS